MRKATGIKPEKRAALIESENLRAQDQGIAFADQAQLPLPADLPVLGTYRGNLTHLPMDRLSAGKYRLGFFVDLSRVKRRAQRQRSIPEGRCFLPVLVEMNHLQVAVH